MIRYLVLITLSVLLATPVFAAKGSAKKSAKVKPATASAKVAKPNQLVDSRDKQKYRTVTIAGLEWMGDNLNYETAGSFCYKDEDDQCMAYGRLYTWDAAKGACPAGFRLPTHQDFESLWTAAGADFNAGYLLKTDYGWNGDTNGNDTLKFSAMPAGNRFDDETYGNMMKFAFFWSADDSSEGIPQGSARVWYLTSKSMAFGYMAKPKDFGFSVRCVREK